VKFCSLQMCVCRFLVSFGTLWKTIVFCTLHIVVASTASNFVASEETFVVDSIVETQQMLDVVVPTMLLQK